MNRRTFFAIISGGLALPFMRKAPAAPKPLPPIPDLPGYKTVWVKPRNATSQMIFAPCEYCGRSFPLHELTLLHIRIANVRYRDVRGCRDCVICSISGVTDFMRGVPK